MDSKVGEGGSLDFESKFGGSPDKRAVNQKYHKQKGSTPEQRKSRTRASTLKVKPNALLLRIQRKTDQVLLNVEQAELASELTFPKGIKLFSYQANNVFGEFKGEKEGL